MCIVQEENLALVRVPAGQELVGPDRHESILRCIDNLVHACICASYECTREGCHKMKKVIQHTKMCRRRENSNCPVCKQLLALCSYHARHCDRNENCDVPFCLNIRQQLLEAQVNQE